MFKLFSHPSHPIVPILQRNAGMAAPWLRLPAPSRAPCPADPGNRASGVHQISKKTMASMNIGLVYRVDYINSIEYRLHSPLDMHIKKSPSFIWLWINTY
jgi:hypothetical protein